MDGIDNFSDNNEETDILDKNNTTFGQDVKNWWNNLGNSYDWKKMPIHGLILVILGIGAVLMFYSIYSFTKIFLVSLFAPAFSELGILAWNWAKNRSKNSNKQNYVTVFMRGWHIFTSTSLLIANLAVETAQQMLNLKVDGATWIIFGLIGLTSLFDVVAFYLYSDWDDETTAKHSHAKNIERIKLRTTQKKLEVYEQSENVKSDALVAFWKSKAPALADLQGRLEAAKEIKNIYSKVGMTPEEAENYLNSIGLQSGIDKIKKELDEEPKLKIENNLNNDSIPEQPKQKRAYHRKEIPQFNQLDSQNIPEQKEQSPQNFTNGVPGESNLQTTTTEDW